MTTNFSWSEARCRCGCATHGPSHIVLATAERLERLRTLCGDEPLHVSSWYRCNAHPAERGKPRGSLHRHTTGRAVDIHCRGELRFRILENFRAAGFRSLGVYRWGLHLDWMGDEAGFYENRAVKVPRFWIG